MLGDKPVVQRRFDLDWLRVISIFAVFIFHCTRFFDTFDWHVKNPTTYHGVQVWTMFQATWGMPLIFVISGASVYFSVTAVGKYIKSKVMRLLVPFAIGVGTHVALAVYLERITHHQFNGTFFEFYLQYFQGIYGEGGNFAWMGLHLWYLLVLFVFSLIFLPLFYLLKGPGKTALTWLGNLFAKPFVFYLLALPIMWLTIKIDPESFVGRFSWGGWIIVCYIPFFLYGFLLISNDGLQAAVKKFRWVSLGLAITCSASLIYLYNQYAVIEFDTPQYAIINGLIGMNGWLWVLTMMGVGMQYLNFANRFLFYATEAVLPFYILHQTVILIIGYYVTRWNIPDLLKFVVILVCSFMVVMVLYEFLIRRSNILRVMFGLKPRPKTRRAVSNAPGTAELKPF